MGLFNSLKKSLASIVDKLEDLIHFERPRPEEPPEEPPWWPDPDSITSDFADVLKDNLINYSPVGDEPYDVEYPYYTERDSKRTGRPSTIHEGWIVNASGGVIEVDHEDAERVKWLRAGLEGYDIPARKLIPRPSMFFWHGHPKRWPDDDPGWRRPALVQHPGMKPHVADGAILSEVEEEFDVLSDHDFVAVALSEAIREFSGRFEGYAQQIAGAIIEGIADDWGDVESEEF